MLKQSEIQELRDGTWELDCPQMILRRSSESDEDVYEGGGYIKRDQDGGLRFKLYSERQVDIKSVFRPKGTPGKLIDDQEYYEMSVTDAQGRTWKSDRILTETDGCAGTTLGRGNMA